MITVPAPVGLGRDTAKRKAAREALAKVLWGPRGARRLPAERELVRAEGFAHEASSVAMSS